mgnify:FL=1
MVKHLERRPRVLHVIARMNVGGTAVYLSNLVLGLEKLGIENLLVIGAVPPGEVEDSVVEKLPIHRVPSMSRAISYSADRAARKEIEKIIGEFKPDLIHTHTFKAGALVRSVRKGVAVVHTFHGHHLYDPEFGFVKRSILNMWERRLAKRTDAIVTIGERVKRELLEVGIGKESQYISIPPGISDLKLGSKTAAMKKLGIAKERRPIVVWLGRFTEVKRPDRVIELAKKAEGFFFVMAGGGELEESIRASAPANVLVAGWQKKEEMWAIADIALCTSDSEGMPLSLIEAQMAGIPVVSTNVGSVDEIVVDGVTGRLGKRDVELLSGLEWVKTNQKRIVKKSALSRKIKKLAHEKFKVETMATAHRELYRKLGV